MLLKIIEMIAMNLESRGDIAGWCRFFQYVLDCLAGLGKHFAQQIAGKGREAPGQATDKDSD
ncbi:hypothetical protein SAMN06265218_11036 [Fodinibius sediminis]|uniref:Uncharacterized protein n=1 Tax=Fodinibius sediminis TaxID=1214077 RepID=A0A521DH09_9BACT|nr:hypothetical protein SAMN06265218_11036 [Fodinibius sediminis]